jgi:CMP-N-acetylneuraminic acid synthetase
MKKSKVKFLGVIPVKTKEEVSYSKKKINGLPLIHWSIKYARESKKLRFFVILSDDKEIKKIAKSYGVSVVSNIDEQYNPEIIVWLRITSPIRHKGVIDDCISVFEEEKSDFLVTGYKKDDEFTPTYCVEIERTSKKYGVGIQFKVSEEYNFAIKSDLEFVAIEAVMKHLGLTL